MKTINAQRIELKGAGICQIDENVLTIKGKDLKCKERGNIFYIESGSSCIAVGGNNSVVVVGGGNIVGIQNCIIGHVGVNVGNITQNVAINKNGIICNGVPVKRKTNTSSDLKTLKYKLVNPIRELKITGAGDFIVDTDMFDKDEVEITLKGSGDFNINNIKSKNVYIDLIGSGDIEVGGIEADNLIVRLKGSGDIEIDYAKAKNLDVKLLGSGDIEVNGDFKNITKTKIGSGDIDIN